MTYAPLEAPPHFGSAQRELFVAGGQSKSDSVVDIFALPSYRNAGSISRGVNSPDDLWVGKTGDLYVADQFDRRITEYAPDGKSPTCSYHLRSNEYPYGLTTDDENRVYVAAGYHLRYDFRAFLDVFEPCGKQTRHQEIAASSFAGGVAVDRQGDIFVSYEGPTAGKGSFVEFVRGSSNATYLGAQISGVASAMPLIIDRNENLIAANGSDEIYVVAPPYSSATAAVSGLPYPSSLSLNRDETFLYDANGYGESVNVYKYPSFAIVKTLDLYFGDSGPLGVAARPDATF